MLISNKDSFFDACVQKEEDDLSGMIKGRGDLGIFLDLVPRNKEIHEQDIIVTSDMGGVFPSGLLVGRVKQVIRNDIESLQQAEIETSFDLQSLHYLFIISEY